MHLQYLKASFLHTLYKSIVLHKAYVMHIHIIDNVRTTKPIAYSAREREREREKKKKRERLTLEPIIE